MKSLNHANVVKTIDLNYWRGKRYLAMEYIDGVPLNNLIKKGIAFPEQDIIKLARSLVSAFKYLAESRHAPFIRIDCTAANIIVMSDGSPCVIDIEPVKWVPKSFKIYAKLILGLRDARRGTRMRNDSIRFFGRCSLRMMLPPTPVPSRIYQTDKARLAELTRQAIERGYDKDLIGLAVASVADPSAVKYADWERVLSASA